MHAIEFDDVSHNYGKTPVLRDISLNIGTHTITAVVGKSGSGKSTLLQTVNGMIRPTGGRIRLFGQPIDYSSLFKLRSDIGYSVQGTGLFPHMTVHQNIALLARIKRYPKEQTEARIAELMNFVDLDLSFLDKYPYQLSGGEQQRVGICRAMVLNPRIFLLDEAFGALDPNTRYEIHQELKRLQAAEPRTILLVTHDMAEAVDLGDVLVVLDEGRIQQTGKPEEVVNHPANEAVEQMLQRQIGDRD